MSEDLIERLRELSASRKPHYGGAHGQIVGMESYRIIANGFALECVDEAADRIVTLEQQLADREAEVADLRNDRDTWKARAEFSYRERDKLTKREVMLRKQVSADVAQILKLLDVIDSVRGPTGATEGIQEHAQHIEKVALAATADLDGLILCEREPVGYIFQHEDTGRTMCVEAQQVEWNFEKNNPRLFKVGPLYAPKGLNHGN